MKALGGVEAPGDPGVVAFPLNTALGPLPFLRPLLHLLDETGAG